MVNINVGLAAMPKAVTPVSASANAIHTYTFLIRSGMANPYSLSLDVTKAFSFVLTEL